MSIFISTISIVLILLTTFYLLFNLNRFSNFSVYFIDYGPIYYDVPATEENRLDLIAYKFFGSAQYSWIISYFNNIDDGYSVYEGQRLKILKNFTGLFNSGELLAPIPAMQLNLGEE